MSVALLDANVLVALFWGPHSCNVAAQHWFNTKASHGWATCPITEAAFIRTVSNPVVTPKATSVKEAIELLAQNTNRPHHKFWADDVLVSLALHSMEGLTGYRQVTDAYLLALVAHHKGTLVTFDRGLVALGDRNGLKVDLLQP